MSFHAGTHPIRLLFVSHSSEWGGAENYLYRLVAGLDRAKFAPIVVLPKPGILQEKIESLGVPTRYAELRWWVGTAGNDDSQYIDFVSGLKRRVQLLSELIQNENIELVFTNTAVILEGALAAYVCGKQHVWHVLELLESNPSLFPYLDLKSVFTLMNLLADKIVVNSESALSQLLPFVPSGKAQKVYFGLEPIDETQIVRDRQRVLGLDPSVPILLPLWSEKNAQVFALSSPARTGMSPIYLEGRFGKRELRIPFIF